MRARAYIASSRHRHHLWGAFRGGACMSREENRHFMYIVIILSIVSLEMSSKIICAHLKVKPRRRVKPISSRIGGRIGPAVMSHRQKMVRESHLNLKRRRRRRPARDGINEILARLSRAPLKTIVLIFYARMSLPDFCNHRRRARDHLSS